MAPEQGIPLASVADRLGEVGLDDLPERPDPALVEAALRGLRQKAEGLDAIGLRLLRDEAIAKLKSRKVDDASGLVDAALRGLGGGGSDLQGQGLQLRDPEPWPEPVDGAELLDALEALFRKHIILPDGAAEALALWIVHTYCLDAAEVTPRLAITSPTKQCGKTNLLKVVGALAARPLPASNISTAAIFRAVEAARPTLLIDEAETFLRENEELRGVLNSGHSKGVAWVVRVVGEGLEPRRFSTWAATAIALIGRLPATLEDRSIAIGMRRRAPSERVERIRGHDLEVAAAPLRRRLVRWSGDWTEALSLRALEPEVPAALDDRAADNWRPLLAIADAAGGTWPARAREVALALSAARAEAEDSRGVLALGDLRELFAREGEAWLPAERAVEALVGLEERPWGEYRRGRPLTTVQLAALLRPFSIRTSRPGGRQDRRCGYRLADLLDAIRRYLPQDGGLNSGTQVRADSATTSDNSDPGTGSGRTRVENVVSPGGNGAYLGTRVDTPPEGEERATWTA